MKKMPENFANLSKTHPFKIFLTKKEEEEYITVEKLSILYDFFEDKRVSISNIGIPLKINKSKINNVCLVANLFPNRPLSIKSASIEITQDESFPSGTFTVIAGIFPGLDDNGNRLIYQYIKTNLTKYACGVYIEEL